MEVWNEIKKEYTKDHQSKGLKFPERRITALKNVESILKRNQPYLLQRPELLLDVDPAELIEKLERWKNSPLNGTEKAVVEGLYPFIHAVVSGKPLETKKPEVKVISTGKKDAPKIVLYKALASLVYQTVKNKILDDSKYAISKKVAWLTGFPTKEQFPKTWESIKQIYHELNGFALHLDDVIAKNPHYKSEILEVDILLYKPHEMIVEFDEEQHFNQYRLITLESPFYHDYKGIDLRLYKDLSGRIIKGGTREDGFHYLQKEDPLFPEKKGNLLQDNKDRQRAFRDFLKDMIAIEKGIGLTVRIPGSLVEWKRTGLSDADLELIAHDLTSRLGV